MNIVTGGTNYKLKLPIQFFAEGDTTPAGNGDTTPPPGTDPKAGNPDDPATPALSDLQAQEIAKQIKAAEDRIRNEAGKKQKALEETIEQLKNQGKSKEELAADAQEKFQAAQQELARKEANFYASQKLNEAKLDSKLLSFVVTIDGDDEETRNAETDNKIKTLTDLINAEVAAQVQEKFKSAGYIPGSGNTGGTKQGPSLLETIRANQIKK